MIEPFLKFWIKLTIKLLLGNIHERNSTTDDSKLMAQLTGKNLPAMQETQEMQVWSLGGEDPLEKEMATHSSILAWEIPRTEEPGGL